MPGLGDLARRRLSTGLLGLAGLACAACCVLPGLVVAGVLSGVGWATLGSWMPGISLALASLAAAAWWWFGRRQHTTSCGEGASCTCGT
jgi:mercuric ion transport protein